METTVRAWLCEHAECGRVWLAKDSIPPRLCSGCKRTGWHKTASVRELIRESGVGLDARIREVVLEVLSEHAAYRAPVAPVGEVLPPVKPDLAALRAICAGNIAPVAVHVEAVSQLPPCPHVEWLEQEGESYACRLSAGHRGKCARGERIA